MLSPDAREYLSGLTAAVVQASRVPPGEAVVGSPTNTTDGTLIRPGGRACYPSCWVRDFAMSLDAGFVTVDETYHHLRLFAATQNGPTERRLAGGGILPPFAIADHVNFDGRPVFYPGTMTPDDWPAGGQLGVLPPYDDHYYFIHVAHHLWSAGRSAAFLNQPINDLTLFDRLLGAFDVPTADEVSGAVTTTDEQRAVGFGFFDTVYMTGAMLVPTLLRYQAAQELSALCRAAQQVDRAEHFTGVAQRIRAHVADVFAEDAAGHRWLRAATGVSGQSDVWGTLLALYLGVLPAALAQECRRTVAQALRDGTIECEGAVRQVPTDRDAGPDTAWERCLAPRNTYQNGAYWHTATGWLIAALRTEDAAAAQAVCDRYLAHLERDDFRHGPDRAAPWECFGRAGRDRQNAVYMTSVTVPLAILQQMPA